MWGLNRGQVLPPGQFPYPVLYPQEASRGCSHGNSILRGTCRKGTSCGLGGGSPQCHFCPLLLKASCKARPESRTRETDSSSSWKLLCRSCHPKCPPVTLISWGSCLCIVPSHIEPRRPEWPTEDGRREGVWLLKLGHSRHCTSTLPPWTVLYGGGQAPRQEEVQVACGEAGMKRSQGLLPTAGVTVSAVGVSHLGSESSSPSQIFTWLGAQPMSDYNLMRAPKPLSSQNHSVKPPHNSWSRETETDRKWLVLF